MRLPSALRSLASPRCVNLRLKGKLAVIVFGAATLAACQPASGPNAAIRLPTSHLPAKLASAPNVPGDPENGRRLFTDSRFYPPNGCGTCHTVAGLANGAYPGAPNLTNVSLRPTLAGDTLQNSPAQMTAWIMDPPAMKRDARMPKIQAITEQEARDLTAFIYSLPYNPVQ